MSVGVRLHGGTEIRTDPGLLLSYAGQLDQFARLVEHLLGRLAAVNGSPVLLPAAALDPVGAAQVLQSTAGCLVLATTLLAGCQALATALRLAADGYLEADRLERRGAPVIEAVRHLPAALESVGRRQFRQAIVADPYLADVGLDWLALSGGLLLGGRTGLATLGEPGELAGALAPLYRDGRPVLARRPAMPTLDARGAPRSSADLLADLVLRERNDRGGGAIDLRLLDGPGGRRVIVDITGTTEWNVDPLRPSRQATDLGTNLRALAGQSSVMSRGVTEALRVAGVRPDEPIMLVGHSQGGMVAAQLADEYTRTGEFRVSHVVTAGSPIGLAAVPRSVSVLSLENRGDLVPELDGADNPSRPTWLTAQVAQPGITGQHAITAYQAAARALDADHVPALARWRAGVQDFLRARTVRTVVFQVSRR